MGSSNEDIIKAILSYQERLERYNLKKSEDKILYVIQKLSKLPIKTSHLESTGVGRTVNALKKLSGKVGDSAKDLVMSWKEMVLEEEKAGQETSLETEDSVYSSENESQDLGDEEEEEDGGKENIKYQSNSESDDEEHINKREIPSQSQHYLEHKTSKYKEDKHHNKNKSSDSSSSNEEESNRHSRKRDHSSESSSDERSRHKKKKSKRDKENSSSNHHKHKDKSVKDERSKTHEKKDRHSSSSKNKTDDRSESKHKSKRDSEQSNHKLEKDSKHKDKTEKDKKSSHSSKHKSSSSQSSNKESKDKRVKEKQEGSRTKSTEKKPKEKVKDEKKKSKDTNSGSSSQSKDKHSSSENGTKKEKKGKVKSISKEKIINGIGSESGASFAEALGMCGPVSSQSNKKKPTPDKKSVKPSEFKSESSTSKSKPKYEERESSESPSPQTVPELLAEEPSEPLNICLSSLLPEITPNYKPTPINLDLQSRKIYNDDEALSRVMSNKNQRTKVYSGNKIVGKVESLFQLCVRILQDNIDALEYTGGVPYLILKPIMDRATPDQLFNLEHHNPYLIEDTDELWQLHCQKDFRTKKREELESWREMYMRCLDEREARLNFITANIKQSQDKSEPVRTTKLAYIDSAFVKPPRNIARKQAKNGTETTDRKVSPTQKLSVLAKSGEAEKTAVPNPAARAERSSTSSSASMKPKKAPLMAKTLSFFKNRFKR